MDNSKLLEKYIVEMSETEDSVSCIAKVFAPVADAYGIGQLRSRFFVEPTFSTRNGESREDILFKSEGAVEEEAAYSITYRTGENGTAEFFLYRRKGYPSFTEEEKMQLLPYLKYLFVHFGRYRMIHAVKEMGLVDLQTGLPNASGFLAYVKELNRTGELPEYNGFYFNLSHFSLINKRFGVKETDRIICRYAEQISGFAVDGECIARLGGDNFVALIKKARTFEFLDRIASVKTYGAIGEREYTVVVSASAGVCEIDETIIDGGTIIDNCAVALHTARHMEKTPYVFCNEQIKERIYTEKKCVTDFERALKYCEFQPHYQPKVNTDDFTIVGAEALVRWNRGGKVVLPSEFVPIYERNGMICQLDFCVFEQVCKDIRGWLDAGIEPVRISMNFSRKHLSNPNLADEITSTLEKYRIDSKYIEIELTETVDEEETEKIVYFMKEMKKRNVSMSVDDFGTGYSSLNLLRSFPVDVLKIDKSFIDTQEENDKIVLSNIIHMANQLHMSVVAEGVETIGQMEYLRQMNCKVVQGYLFDRPMPKEQFEKKMQDGKYDIK